MIYDGKNYQKVFLLCCPLPRWPQISMCLNWNKWGEILLLFQSWGIFWWIKLHFISRKCFICYWCFQICRIIGSKAGGNSSVLRVGMRKNNITLPLYPLSGPSLGCRYKESGLKFLYSCCPATTLSENYELGKRGSYFTLFPTKEMLSDIVGLKAMKT